MPLFFKFCVNIKLEGGVIMDLSEREALLKRFYELAKTLDVVSLKALESYIEDLKCKETEPKNQHSFAQSGSLQGFRFLFVVQSNYPYCIQRFKKISIKSNFFFTFGKYIVLMFYIETVDNPTSHHTQFYEIIYTIFTFHFF